MKIRCIKCKERIIRTSTSIKESARLQGITSEEYINTFVCRKCRPKKINQKTKPESENVKFSSSKKEFLVMTELCQVCLNTCKVYTVSEKAILKCPRYHRKETNDTIQEE